MASVVVVLLAGLLVAHLGEQALLVGAVLAEGLDARLGFLRVLHPSGADLLEKLVEVDRFRGQRREAEAGGQQAADDSDFDAGAHCPALRAAVTGTTSRSGATCLRAMRRPWATWAL